MIPAFGGLARGALAPRAPSSTLLDVPLVLRLVRGFLREGAKAGGGGAAAARVARLVDAYLAEAALEAGLRPAEFEELVRAVPAHARAADDGLYRAVGTYLKRYDDQIVAIKVLNRGGTPEEKATLEARFIREVNMMCKVKHENLVKMVIVSELLPALEATTAAVPGWKKAFFAAGGDL